MTTQANLAAAHEEASMVVRPTDLTVVLRKEQHGPEIAREPVRESDMADLRAQLWLDGWLRAGRPDVPYEAISFEITARRAEGHGAKCEDLVVSGAHPEGRTHSLRLTTHAFQDVASRASVALLGDHTLRPEDLYLYEVALAGTPTRPEDQALDGLHFTVRPQRAPLEYLSVPIGPLVARSEAVGKVRERALPVFYTTEALLRAQRYARKGADCRPPTETGGVLVGPLCSCPETGEFFVVVADVLEARDAEGSSLSLTYTGKTWSRIQTVIRAKQAQEATRAYRIVGQAHGHNVLPGGSCETCEKAATCSLTSVFVSHDDRTWSQAVFAGQPWQLCHIFGLNSRSEEVHALFSLRENRLKQRAFYLLPDFDPARDAVPASHSEST